MGREWIGRGGASGASAGKVAPLAWLDGEETEDGAAGDGIEDGDAIEGGGGCPGGDGDAAGALLLTRDEGIAARGPGKGRHRKWNRSVLVARVCAMVADGRSLRSACRELGVPPRTFFSLVHDDPAVAAQYDKARRAQAHLLHGDLLDVARDSMRAKTPEEAKGYQNTMRAIESLAAAGDRRAFGVKGDDGNGGERVVRIILEEPPLPNAAIGVRARVSSGSAIDGEVIPAERVDVDAGSIAGDCESPAP